METSVNTEVRNSTGIIELNRARALNSLNQEMIDLIQEALDKWIDDDAVHRIIICSTSDRAFCAGGDVRAVREAVLEGKPELGDHFFIEEFNLNDDLGNYPKPIIAIIDGVVMGGGLGISIHGSHRIITEKSFAAMPEMAIGYVPDVGFSYFIQRSTTPAIGAFLAVTGWRMSPADMLWTGVATDFIRSKDVEAFSQAVCDRSLEEALAEYAVAPDEPSKLAAIFDQITETFSFSSWTLIDAALSQHPDTAFVNTVRELLSVAAPASVVASIALFAANQKVETLREGLDNELALSLHMIRQADFLEGVRAVLVDKQRDAVFNPATYEKVDEAIYTKLLNGF